MTRKPSPHGSTLLENLSVVLVSTRNPLNIGAAARAMSNFGFSSLRVVNPYEVAFREARSAVGASELLRNAQQYATVADAVADCALVVGTTAARERQLQHPLRTLQQGAVLIRKRMARSRVALLFGSEKRGLSNEDFSHCEWLMRIPTREAHPAMNLGQAVAVCLYEVGRQSPKLIPADKLEHAAAGDLDRLATSLLEALRISGYTHSDKDSGKNIRRLLRRLSLSSDDSTLLLGMLRQMLWKMKNTD